MLGTLKSLGDDWHNPHPYEKLIRSILPEISYPQTEKIEKCLLAVYEAEHYDFKIYKDKNKFTLYDVEVVKYEQAIKNCEAEMKKEQEFVAQMYKKLEEVYQEQKKHGFLQEEYYTQEGDHNSEEDYDEDEYQAKKTKKQAKEQNLKKKQLQASLAASVKSVQSSMVTSQHKCIEYQEELDRLEGKKTECERQREASLYYQDGMRSLVLEYEKTRDLNMLVKGLKNMLTRYNELLHS